MGFNLKRAIRLPTVKQITTQPLKQVENYAKNLTGPLVGKGYDVGKQLLGMGPAPKGAGDSAWLGMSDIERQAGATPAQYESLRDETGKLKSQYAIDPFSGAASAALRSEALSQEPSAWTKTALGNQAFEQAQQMGAAGLQNQQAQSQAQAQLMRQGGLGGGARTSLARSGARDAMMAAQNVGAQGVQSRFGINQADVSRKQSLLGTTADVERQAQLQNLGTLTGDISGKLAADQDRYKTIMGAWGANAAANAQRAAGGQKSGKK